jgi:hypothetical protein
MHFEYDIAFCLLNVPGTKDWNSVRVPIVCCAFKSR